MTAILDKTTLRKAKREGWADWIRCEADEMAVRDGCYFDQTAVDRVCRFFERALRHSKGEWGGKPFALMDWQKKHVVGPIFGWKQPDGLRRIRRAYVEIPKKNGKSTLASGIGLYMLVGDNEPGAIVFSAATKKEQAAIVHGEAINMVKSSPLLSKLLKVNNTNQNIIYEQKYAAYRVLASDAKGAEGENIHCLISDELHVWKGRAFRDSLRYGFAARAQPLDFMITTAGLYNPETIGWTEHDYALQWLDGQHQDALEYYAFIAAADKEDDFLDPATHKKANPSYGITIKPEEMMRAARDAKAKKSELGPFLRYRLNIWTQQAESYFDLEKWKACGGEVDPEKLRGRRCFGGLDLASRQDVAAWVLLFPPAEDDPLWRVLVRFFVPEATAERRESEEGVKYATWARQGLMILTHGPAIEYARIVQQIVEDAITYDIEEVGADPWQLDALRDQVFEHVPDVKFERVSQTFRDLSEPTKQLESLILTEQLAHGGHPVLEWMAGNAVPIEDGNENIRLSKKRSKDKIDGLAAMLSAMNRAMVSEGPTAEPGVYAL